MELLGNEALDKIAAIMRNAEAPLELQLRAATYLADQGFGKARTQSNVEVSVSNPAMAHVNALQSLTTMARGANLPHNAHNNPLKRLDDLNSRDELSLNHAPIIDAETVPIAPGADSVTGDSADAGSAETPPAPPPGRGRK